MAGLDMTRAYDQQRAQQKQRDKEKMMAEQENMTEEQRRKRRITADELIPLLRKKGIEAFGERASRSWEQGAYSPDGQFWMLFWDFVFNFTTDFLLKAGYLDVNKIGTESVQSMKNTTPTGIPGYYGATLPGAAPPGETPAAPKRPAP